MSLLYIAPDEFDAEYLCTPKTTVKIFLAGGITNCKDWQSRTTGYLLDNVTEDNVWIYNPRRTDFDMDADQNIEAEQIAWEFRHLEEMDIFSMFFAASPHSVGPICLYELGRNVLRMQMRFPNDWQKRIVIGIEDGYLRTTDVKLQMAHAAPAIRVRTRCTPEMHGKRIADAVNWLLDKG